MKYMDYAAMGAAVSASQRASEAFDEIDRLQSQIEELRSRAWDDREEREFQKWIEELIYQFGKVTGRIETSPGDPVEDFREIVAYFKLVQEKRVDTSVIMGLENKRVFEDILGRAEKLLGDQLNHPEVVERRNSWIKKEAERTNRLASQEREKNLYLEKEADRFRKKQYAMGAVASIIIICLAITINIDAREESIYLFFGIIIWLIVWMTALKYWRRE